MCRSGCRTHWATACACAITFPAMPVEEWKDEAQALMQVNVNPGDICVVETDSPWIDACMAGKAGTASIIGGLARDQG